MLFEDKLSLLTFQRMERRRRRGKAREEEEKETAVVTEIKIYPIHCYCISTVVKVEKFCTHTHTLESLVFMLGFLCRPSSGLSSFFGKDTSCCLGLKPAV